MDRQTLGDIDGYVDIERGGNVDIDMQTYDGIRATQHMSYLFSMLILAMAAHAQMTLT